MARARRSSGPLRRDPSASRRQCLAWLCVGAAALGLVGLRVHLFRLRYALAQASGEERELQKDERVARGALASLRDPQRLARIADERGYRPPERVIRLQSGGGPRGGTR